MEIAHIRERIRNENYVVSFTHTEKLRRRKIGLESIEQAIIQGEIIEDYPEDPRGPSCLIYGKTSEERPIHIVCGDFQKDTLLIITAYEPNPTEWEADWKTRKKGIEP